MLVPGVASIKMLGVSQRVALWGWGLATVRPARECGGRGEWLSLGDRSGGGLLFTTVFRAIGNSRGAEEIHREIRWKPTGAEDRSPAFPIATSGSNQPTQRVFAVSPRS